MSEQHVQQDEDEQAELWAIWRQDAENWRAAQIAWEQYLDELAERVQKEGLSKHMEQLGKVREREAGGKWLYELWLEEWRVGGMAYMPTPWERLPEEIRERYRHLWERIYEGFTALSH